ncbi:hypothetical protein [Janthinobacterium sp. 61]|uniref:hypothetical protein n=1 Tax=Janthinobacterium sp. 61 TaxID=2035209 RepID=UPI00117B78E7|nr:hypothetical protein [Janthinobacterium sp. 61]
MKKYITIILWLTLLFCEKSSGEIVTISSGTVAKEEIVSYKTTCTDSIYKLEIDKKNGAVKYSTTSIKQGIHLEIDISKSEMAKFFLDRSYFGNFATSCGNGLHIDYRGFQVNKKVPSSGFNYRATISNDGKIARDKKFNDLPSDETP